MGCQRCSALEDRTDSPDALLESLEDRFEEHPNWLAGNPIPVRLSLYVESVTSPCVKDMEFDADVFLKMSWKDERYRHHSSAPFLINEEHLYRHMWKPDIYFSNARKAKFHHVVSPNTYFRIFRNGEIAWTTRVTLTSSCHMNLRKYPMDRQRCLMKMLSLSYTLEKLDIKWDEDLPIDMNPRIRLGQMKLVRAYPYYCNGSFVYVKTESFYMRGKFPCLTANFVMIRLLGYHLTQTYIPTTLIVLISWISFFVDPLAIPARIALSFTTLLTMSTLSIGIRNSLPPLDYMKAIDVWMGACMSFLFLALLEFAAVNSTIRHMVGLKPDDITDHVIRKTRSLHYLKSVKSMEVDKLFESKEASADVSKAVLESEKQHWRSIAHRIDIASRICFPVVFVIFNIAYWSYYLSDP